ncbi:unnamed protein product [Cylindrotheca closterium]|uniref:Signal recognition particle subunit SRP68 n=1 Tax=Cylindrotheca closterium TaxID=2856 RepID=A0AAD2CJ96_9STRA|nr:unnamed protein product [Cylindrotheca closterium]
MTEELQSRSSTPPFQLNIHEWIESQQSAHGVRHDDYAQYHGYCTRRLSRLSHHPDVKKHLVCSSKFASDKSAAKGRGRHAYCSRQNDTFANNEETGKVEVPHSSILWYLVVLAERSWAHANMLQKQKKQRQNVLRKLKKATLWAKKLEEIAKDCTDSLTQQECQAYASWMVANLALEKMDYQMASQEYANAMSKCHALSKQVPQLVEERRGGEAETQKAAKLLERQDLFVNRADTLLRPLFRYSQYELKQAGLPTMDEPQLDITAVSNNAKKSAEDIAIEFRGQDLVLDSKDLRVLLLKLQSMQQEKAASESEEEKVAESNEGSFLEILSVLDDALDVVQNVLSSFEQANSGPAVQAKRTQYLQWKGYLQYEKTRRVMNHTELLLKDITGHAERVHVYDALLQHSQSLLNLPRPQADGNFAAEEEEDEFSLQVQANVLRLRALKSYHMAWYYYEKPRKYDHAFALIQQSSKLMRRAQEEIAACDEDMPRSDEYLQELDDLPFHSTIATIQAAMYLQQTRSRGKSGAAIETDRPLLLRLNENDSGTVLAALTPIPIPCKLGFFDLAYTYAMDSTDCIDEVQKYLDIHTVEDNDDNEDSPSASSGGWLGWLSG